MKRMVIAWVASALLAETATALTLEEGFRTPPDSAKPHTWYHMMNGNVSKEGITCDFEALAQAGIGGVQMFDAGCNVPPGPVAFNSPEWFDLFHHAASEARRLGLEICIPNCSGWSSSGGPWNMPSNAMKLVTYREVRVKGPSKYRARLPREEQVNGYYEDIAVIAFPTPPADSVAFPDVKTAITGTTAVMTCEKPFAAAGLTLVLEHGWAWSAWAQVTLEASENGRDFTVLDRRKITLCESGSADDKRRFFPFAKPVTAKALRVSLANATIKVALKSAKPEARMAIAELWPKTFHIRQDVRRAVAVTDPTQVVPKEGQIDLSGKVSADGTLDWDVPAGDWTILRLGNRCNGRQNHPASDHGRGLEVDKLSASAMDFHFSQYVTRLCEKLGPLAGDVASGFNNILVDSYEVGSQNWTQGLDKIFARRCGYAMRPYFPVFAGHVVGSVDESERFLEDFRRTVADLFAENYAGRLAELCHRHGLKLSLEPYGNCPADNLQYGEAVDIPMGEFWSNMRNGGHGSGVGNSKFIAHLAHVWGRRYAATESFTAQPNTGGRWRTTPFTIKSQGDKAYAAGVNRIIYHRFTHQPWPGEKYVPGMTMGRWGMHLDRTQTWWKDYAADWFRYQARCQWMLQEGAFVADVLFYCGEQAPNQGGNTDGTRNDGSMTLPPGYDWDVCATKALKLLKVVDGDVIVPGGVRYRLLVLPPQETMGLETLATVRRLVEAGAKICCLQKPTRAPGLRGYPQADGEVRRAADEIWARGVMMCPPAEALKRLGVEPDFVCAEKEPAANWIHRRDGGTDWYFVALDNVAARRFEVSLRESGRVPEIWDAVTGERRPAPTWRAERGRTIVTLDFEPSGSRFIVLRRPAEGCTGACAETTTVVRAMESVDGLWQVAFPAGWGAPASVTFPTLQSWSEHADEGVRYFSGTAVYRKMLQTVAPKSSERVVLDLGEVREFATVTVNGRRLAPLWKPPFRVDVTDALDAPKDGQVTLDLAIKVTNLWPNRLIGDDRQFADDCEWTGTVQGGVKEIGVKEIPAWVKDGKPSPTGRHTFTTWKHWDKNDKLLPSGLLGPVTLQFEAHGI